LLCFPAHDEADEVAAAMLAQLMEQAGRVTVTFPAGSSTQSMLDLVKPGDDDMFCISSIPPFAFSHSRNLHRQLRTRFPRTKILIGVWGFTGDTQASLQRFKPAPPDSLVTSLAEALEYLGVSAPAANRSMWDKGHTSDTEPTSEKPAALSSV